MSQAVWAVVVSAVAIGCAVALVLLRRARDEARTLAASEARLRTLFENNLDLIAVLDADGVIRHQSPSIRQVMGYAPEEITGTNVFEYLHPADTAAFRRVLEQISKEPSKSVQGIFRCRHADGSWRYFEAVCTNLLQRESVRGFLVNFRDVSERHALQQQLVRQSFLDPLTQLPNRALLRDRLGHALRRASRRPTSVGILFLDLDTFKVINETLGSSQADRVLVAVSERLHDCLRPEDTLARFGGDEFGVLIEDIARPEDAGLVAERIGNALRTPFAIGDREVYVTASIGIAVDPGDADPDTVLRNADLAMYEAKQRGRARHALFEPSMANKLAERLDLEAQLRRAIPAGELRLHFQPVVDLLTGRIEELEALVRWQHPVRGLLTPGHFIPLAEDTDIILSLGQWVLEEACTQAARWRALSAATSDLVVSVNLSGRQLQSTTLTDEIHGALQRAALAPRALKLEVTETVALHGADTAVTMLRALKEVGVRIALDDFGTGYSALTYLKQFPLDTLKLDRSFIHGLGRDPHDTAIVGAVLAFAKGLELDVTAEGIETLDQLNELRARACARGQGYFFSRPLPPAEIEAILRNGSRLLPHAESVKH